MFWMNRLANWKQNASLDVIPTELEPVFVSISKYIKYEIVKELKVQYPWIEISNISVVEMLNQYTFEELLEFSMKSRMEDKIYYSCPIELIVYNLVNRVNINCKTCVDFKDLDNIYNCCLKQLYKLPGLNEFRSVVILDFRSKYFYDNRQHMNELLLYSSAFLALISISYMYPLIDIIVISDCILENRENFTNLDKILYLQNKLNMFYDKSKMLTGINMQKILNSIVSAHVSTTLTISDMY